MRPFRRFARNLAAGALIGAGSALCRWGTAAMWPDDRPASEVDAAITRAAAALEQGVEHLTDAMRHGTARSRDYKSFRAVSLSFLDVRAAAVGDHVWLAKRRAEKERRRARHAVMAEAVLADGPERPERVLDPEQTCRYDQGGPTS